MNLFVVENDATLDLLSPDIYDRARDVILCFNYLVYLKLKNDGTSNRYCFVEELMAPNDYNNLHAFFEKVALNWYCLEGKDLTLYKGISIGEVISAKLSRDYMLSVLLKYGEVIRKAINKWPQIEKIYCDFSNEHNFFHYYEDDGGKYFSKKALVENVCSHHKLTVKYLMPGKYVPSAFIASIDDFHESDVGKRKITLICDLFKAIVRQITTYLTYSHINKNRIYFFCYPNLARLNKYMSRRFILSGDSPNTFKSIIKTIFGRKMLNFNNMKYKLCINEKNSLLLIKEQLRDAVAHESKSNMYKYNGIDYRQIFMASFADLIENVIPKTVVYMGKVRMAIRKYGISKIMVNEEITVRFRAVIMACRLEGVLSVFVDHGIQGNNHVMSFCDRNMSDVFICPGEFYVDYYKSMNRNSKAKFLVMGSPALDCYHKMNTIKKDKIRKVMFLTFEDNFYARLNRFSLQEKYYVEMFSIFNELFDMNIEVVLRPHPSERKEYLDYLIRYCGLKHEKITILQDGTFNEVVKDMDLVVSNVSTCFYEAQAAGVPTVFFEPNFDPNNFLPPLNGINGQDVLRVTSGHELLDFIKKYKDNTEYLNEFLSTFLNSKAEQYMGRVDGLASKRIVDYLFDNSISEGSKEKV